MQEVRRFTLEKDRARCLAAALGVPFVDLEEYTISCGILHKIPAEMACRTRAVPIVWNGSRIVLVVDDPFQAAQLSASPELLRAPAGRRVEFAMTTPGGLDAALRRRLVHVKD